MIEETLVGIYAESIRSHWSQKALSNYKGDTLTYEQVGRNLKYLHYLFEKHGLEKGDKVALLGKNSINWGVIYLAVVTYGAVIVPILPDFQSKDIHYIVNHSEARILFVDNAVYDGLDDQTMPCLEVIIGLDDMAVLCSQNPSLAENLRSDRGHYWSNRDPGLSRETFDFEPVENYELASIVYTSGTTGFSKGVMLSHNALAVNVVFARDNIELNSGNAVVSFLPLAHCYGLAFDFLFPFSIGVHITFLSKIPSPRIIIQAFQDIRPHLIIAVPLILEKVYRKQVRPMISKGSIRTLMRMPVLSGVIKRKIYRKLRAAFGDRFIEIIIGGAALNEEVERFFRNIGFEVTVGYGMTECAPLISYARHSESKFQSVGRPINYLECRIEDAAPDTGIGEICVRGENTMEGYFKNPEATHEALDGDGWLHTGDLGYIDDDGFLFIKGRSKSMILGPSGQNIYPEEIEAQLNYMPYVAESLVVDSDGALVALVYPDMDQIDTDGLSESKLAEQLEQNRTELNKDLPAYSKISRIKIYPREFEKTPSRKIKRYLYTILST
ncbi:MAG TPA: AMP-binding protein [bacterium]|nr:AMP-binding protein [bacterium]